MQRMRPISEYTAMAFLMAVGRNGNPCTATKIIPTAV